MSKPAYAAAIVTFRRPDSLRTVIANLLEQTQAPTMVVVADNDPAGSAQDVVREFASARPGVLYLPVGRNLGPAGGWARGVACARESKERGDWIAIFDDDDPVSDTDVMRCLMVRASAVSSNVAAIGMRGARLNRLTGVVTRCQSADGSTVSADYLASNGAPLYRWSSIDEVGFFDEKLFFGFEDLDLGVRLRDAGFGLAVEPLAGVQVQDSSSTRTAWREYYKTRALVVICRRHLGPVPLIATLTRTLLLGSVLLLLRERSRSMSMSMARWRGAWDGLRGRLGPGRYAPASNPPKA
jgi:GT2 family glycosyltransferase